MESQHERWRPRSESIRSIVKSSWSLLFDGALSKQRANAMSLSPRSPERRCIGMQRAPSLRPRDANGSLKSASIAEAIQETGRVEVTSITRQRIALGSNRADVFVPAIRTNVRQTGTPTCSQPSSRRTNVRLFTRAEAFALEAASLPSPCILHPHAMTRWSVDAYSVVAKQ